LFIFYFDKKSKFFELKYGFLKVPVLCHVSAKRNDVSDAFETVKEN